MHAYIHHQVLSLSYLFPLTSQLHRRRLRRNEMNHRSQICTTPMISVCLRMRLDKRLSNDKQASYQGRLVSLQTFIQFTRESLPYKQNRVHVQRG